MKAICPIHMNPVVRKVIGKGKKGSKNYSEWQEQWKKYQEEYDEHMRKCKAVK